MARFSLEGKVALLTATGAVLTVAIALALEHAFSSVWLSLIFTLGVAAPGGNADTEIVVPEARDSVAQRTQCPA